MQVKKQDINVGKAVFEGDIKSGAEGSIIVPDVKPDILKILQADADAILTEKSVDNGKLVLKGKLTVNVLYTPENDGDGIQCIKGCFEFCETVKRQEFEPGMQVIAFADAKKAGYKLINSRKVGIDAEVVISTQVMGTKKCQIVSDIEEDCAEVKKETVCIDSGENYREFVFRLEETVDFPGTKAAAREILKSNITIFDKEYRAISGKLVVKGRANVSLLYVTENGVCDHIGYELPFTEVFDIEEISEGTECDITFIVEENEAILSVGTDRQSVTVNADVRVCVRREEVREICGVCDCYFTNCIADTKFCEITSEKTVGKPALSCVVKEILEKSEGQPEISGIYTSVAKPHITSTQIQNGRIAVSGKVIVYVLYTSDNSHNPVCSINEEIPFSYMLDCENVSRGDDVLLMAECEHISCTISSPSSVEIRCGMMIKGRVVKKQSIQMVCDAEVADLIEKDKEMVVYFVKNGDTIWDIGKNYHIKREMIMEANDIDENADVIPGERIILPII